MKHGALEGVTKIEGVTSALLQTLNSPPPSLESLTFANNFSQSFQGVILPSSLQSLTFGYCFNQCLEGVKLPSSLQNLTLGSCFGQSLEGVKLPRSLEIVSSSSRLKE